MDRVPCIKRYQPLSYLPVRKIELGYAMTTFAGMHGRVRLDGRLAKAGNMGRWRGETQGRAHCSVDDSEQTDVDVFLADEPR